MNIQVLIMLGTRALQAQVRVKTEVMLIQEGKGLILIETATYLFLSVEEVTVLPLVTSLQFRCYLISKLFLLDKYTKTQIY